MKNVVLVLLALVLTSSAAFALPTFSGMLSTDDGGVTATGIWAQNFMISWDITLQDDNSWFYQYYLTHLDGSAIDPGAVSHWLLEVSPGALENDFWGFNGSPIEIDDWITENGMPFNSALKLDYGTVGQTEWSFYTWRNPVWGDFFAKDGRAGGDWNYAWNTGFANADPMDPAANGTIGNKILRPDTETMIPEPTTLGLLGIGLVGFALRVRKK